jgi:hypothetical protein
MQIPFSTEEDTNIFLSKLNNKNIITLKRLNNYNHLDYLWSSDSVTDLYYDNPQNFEINKFNTLSLNLLSWQLYRSII